MKVKNIMFFGFAAAILSIGAASAAATGYTLVSSGENAGVANAEAYQSGRNIVASKSYVDLKGDQLKVDINNIATTAGNAVPANAAIDPGTHTKITYDANGLVTAGADLAESDIPSLHLNKISDVTADASELNILDGATLTTTELNYVDGVTSSIQDQLDDKEDEDNKVKQGGATGSVLSNASTDTEYPSAKVVYTAIQEVAGTAANAVPANAAIDPGTHTKITYDANGLVTAGADLAESDIPSLHLNKISDVTADASELNILDGATLTTTELNYVDGVTSNIQTQLDSKVGFTDVVPAKGSSCTDANPCVLMQDVNGYNWYTMVTDNQAGGTATVGGAEKANPQQQQ